MTWINDLNFEVHLWKEGFWWLIEAPALDLMTQGKSRRDACAMLADAVESIIHRKGFQASVNMKPRATEGTLTANLPELLIALLLRRQRQKHGLTLMDVARRLGSNSPNTFARYEQGRARPTIAKLLELLTATDPSLVPVLKIPA